MGLLSDFDISSRRMNITEMLDEIRIAKRRENNYFDDGHVRYLEDIVDIQHGNPTMRRLIMADLDIQRMSRDNQIEGWANNYKIQIVENLVGNIVIIEDLTKVFIRNEKMVQQFLVIIMNTKGLMNWH